MAFLIGLTQAVTALLVEILIIVTLSGMKDMLDIIRKFVSMTIIIKFDNMYAAALYDEKMKKAVGKLLPLEFRRKMCFYNEQEMQENNEELDTKFAKEDENFKKDSKK